MDLYEETHRVVRFAARVFGVSEAEVISRFVAEYAGLAAPPPPRPESDPWQAVPVYGDYDGRHVEGLYLPATRRLTVTGEPLPGKRFKSPSGAARRCSTPAT